MIFNHSHIKKPSKHGSEPEPASSNASSEVMNTDTVQGIDETNSIAARTGCSPMNGTKPTQGRQKLNDGQTRKVTLYDKTVGRFANLLGFNKRYNAILFFIFGGIMLGFSLSRVETMVVREDRLIPGAYFWYRQKLYSFGLQLHTTTCLPAAFIAIFQFIPKIRQRCITFHRVNGYLFYLLMLTSVAGAMIVTRHSFGGTITIQSGSGFGAIITVFSAFMAWINIKRLQLDQHRKWMLRCMIYYSSIVTVRVLQIIARTILVSGTIGVYANIWKCDELEFTLDRYDLQDKWERVYAPNCPDPSGFIAVTCGKDGPEEIASGFRWAFGYAMWLSIMLHIIGAELYIRLTPGEDNRLRQVSYERQLEAGRTKNPGNAGTTRDRIGDPLDWPFVPRKKRPSVM